MSLTMFTSQKDAKVKLNNVIMTQLHALKLKNCKIMALVLQQSRPFIIKSRPKFLYFDNKIEPGTVIKLSKNYFIVKTSDSYIKILQWAGLIKKGEILKS